MPASFKSTHFLLKKRAQLKIKKAMQKYAKGYTGYWIIVKLALQFDLR